MTWFELSLGLALGALGALWHLWVLKQRVALIARGHLAKGLLALPLGLSGPVLGVVAAIQIAATSAWATVFGVLLVHVSLLWRLRSKP